MVGKKVNTDVPTARLVFRVLAFEVSMLTICFTLP